MILVAANLSFGVGEAGNTQLGKGWSAPEDGFVWSDGAESIVQIALTRGRGRLVLELACEPFLAPPEIMHQDVALLINGICIDQRRLGGKWIWRVTVPTELTGGTELTIALVREPGTVRLKDETRDLGVQLRTLILLWDTEPEPPAPLRSMRTILFGWCEPPSLELTRGFGSPEDGYVWAIGPESELLVPLDGTGAPVHVLLDMRPFDDLQFGMRQRIVIGADDRLVGFFELRAHLVLALRIEPTSGQRNVSLHIRNVDAAHNVSGGFYHFGLPFAWALHSVRIIAVPPLGASGFMQALPGVHADGSLDQAVEERAGQPLAELVTHFESLGNCCELGILQLELLGHEQPTLLRTSGIPQRELVEGLARDFELLGRPDTMNFFCRPEPDPTLRLTSGIYGLSNPTPYLRSEPEPKDAITRASRAMAWLAAKFLRDQAAGDKIYVLRLPVIASVEEAMLAVLAMLRRRSDAPILWLVADQSSQRGSVARLPSGLLRGQLGPEAAGRGMDPDVLIGLLANAWALQQNAR